MRYEKQNSGFTGLDELTHLPNEDRLDKNLLWQKLEIRLEPKKRRTGAIWYWAVAAVLICILSLSLLLNIDQQAMEVSRFAVIKINDPVMPVDITKETVVVKNVAPIIKYNLPANPKAEQRSLSINKIIQLPIVVKRNETTPLTQPILTHDPLPVADTAITVNTIAVVKKKLSVVHNNELVQEDKQTEETINKVKSAYTNHNKPPKDQYAGTINLRIQLKN